MRIPNPPFAYLSADGAYIAVPNQQELTLLDVGAGTVTTHQLPYHCFSVAFSPDESHAVVSGSNQITWFDLRPSISFGAQATIPAPLFRMALGAQGLLAGAARFSDTKTSLCVWQGAQLQPAFTGEGHLLGSVAPYTMRLNRQNDRVLLAGASGPGAYSGGAKLFAGMLQLSDDRIEVLWKGADLPFQPNGFVYPLAEDRLGIYQRNEFAIVSIQTSSNPAGIELVARYSFPNLETVALSPDGAYLAWFWGSGQNTSIHLRVARLSDGVIIDQGMIDTTDTTHFFPAIAVDNAGSVTYAWSEKPDRLHVWRLERGQCAPRMVVTIPNFAEE